MNLRKTFSEILCEEAAANAQRVVGRAVLSNRVAKISRGARSRGVAYASKRRAVEHAIAKFPERCRFTGIESEIEGGVRDLGVVGLSFDFRNALHIPVKSLTAQSRAWLSSARKSALGEAHRAMQAQRLFVVPAAYPETPLLSFSREATRSYATVFDRNTKVAA